jgi:hypothetical protein
VSELNLSEGLAGTLIDRIVLESNKASKVRGATIAEVTAKRHATVSNPLKTMRNEQFICFIF